MDRSGSESPESDARLGSLAVQLGLVTEDQLAEVLHPADAGSAKLALGARLLMAGLLDEEGLNRLLIEFEQRQEPGGGSDLIGAPVPRAKGNEDATILNLNADAVRAAAFGMVSTPAAAPSRGQEDETGVEGMITIDAPRPGGRRGPPPPPPPAQGGLRRVIEGRFELLDQLGRGGMGVVYKATDRTDGKVVALKMLINKEALESSYKRFVREAKAIMKLDHPNIVKVYHLGEWEGNPYYAMEYVEGQSFGDMIESGKLPLETVASVGRDVARALSAAHANGIIHRDIKPDNILVTRDGVPKVADFGLAKDKAAQTQLTMGGNALGTPVYMPPEQATGQLSEVDRRSDVYSLGATLYEAATGKAPFRGDDPFKIMENVVHQPLVAPSRFRQGLGDLEKIIVKAMAKNKKHRYSETQLMAEDLDRYLRGEPVAGRAVRAEGSGLRGRLWLWILVGTVLAFLIGAAFAWMGSAHAQEPPQAKAAGLAKDARQSLQDAETDRLLGKRDAMKASLEKALATAEQALALDATQAQACAVTGMARRRLAVMTGDEQHYLEAGAALDRAVGLNAEDPEIRMERALAYWFVFVRFTRAAWPILSDPNVAFPAVQPRLDRPAEEAEKYRKLAAADLESLAGHADEGIARAAQAFLTAMTAEPAQTLEAAEKALQGQKYRPELLRVRGRARMDLGNADSARDAVVDFNAYLNLSPGEAGVYAERGTAHHRCGMHAEAIADYAQAETLGAPKTEMAWNRTVCRVAAEDAEAALSEFEAVLAAGTQDAHRWTSRALLHARADRWDEAMKDLTRAHGLSPGNPDVALLLASWQEALGEERAAIKTLNTLLERKPDFADAWAARARLREHVNELAAGIEDFTKALQWKPDDVAILLERAEFHAKRGAWDKSEADLARAIELDPRNPQGHVQRARNASRNKKWGEAVTSSEHALALAPNDEAALLLKAGALFEDGKAEKAFASFDDAVRAQPESVEARLARGTTALKHYDALKAKPDAARKWLEKGRADLKEVERLDPDGDDGKRARKLLAKYADAK